MGNQGRFVFRGGEIGSPSVKKHEYKARKEGRQGIDISYDAGSSPSDWDTEYVVDQADSWRFDWTGTEGVDGRMIRV